MRILRAGFSGFLSCLVILLDVYAYLDVCLCLSEKLGKDDFGLYEKCIRTCHRTNKIVGFLYFCYLMLSDTF